MTTVDSTIDIKDKEEVDLSLEKEEPEFIVTYNDTFKDEKKHLLLKMEKKFKFVERTFVSLYKKMI